MKTEVKKAIRKYKSKFQPKHIGILLMLSCLVSFAMLVTATANIVQRENVRVGYFHFAGYHDRSDNGELSGYGYDILQKMLVYENWKYEYVGDTEEITWSQALDKLDAGELDLITSATKSPERLQKYAYSDIPVGQSYTMLSVKSGDNRFDTDDYSNWNNLRVGMIPGNTRNESFAKYAREHGFVYQAVMLANSEVLKNELDAGRVDMIVTSNLLALQGVRIIDQFDEKPFYVIVRKDNTKLLAEVNDALRKIQSHNNDFAEELQQKYYKPSDNGVISFSREEQKFIDECKANGTVFKAIINTDRKPLTYTDKNGQPGGILVDLTEKVFARSGLQVEFVPTLSREKYIDTIQNHGIDIICDYTNTPNGSEQLGYVVTEPFYNSSIAMLVRANDDGEKKVCALTRNSITKSRFSNQPNIEYVYYDTNEECYEAVKNGTADFSYGYTRAIQEAVFSDYSHSFACIIMPEEEVYFRMAISLDQNAMLSSIISKSVNSLSEVDTNLATEPYTYYDRSNNNLLSLVYDHPVVIVGMMFIVALVIVLLVMLRIDKAKRLAEVELNKKLAATLQAEKAANEAKTAFLSRISHNMRTPLNGIFGLAEGLEAKIDDKSALRDLEKLKISGRHLLHLISDTLDISRIEQGKLVLHPTVCRGRHLLNSIINLTKLEIEDKKIHFIVKADNMPSLYYFMDVGRMEQVVMNILNNAVKFTPEGGTITLKIENLSRQGDFIKIRMTIEDTGIGMSKDFLPHIFEPFSQEDQGITSSNNGTGLGMTITKQIVEQVGGSIDVASELGKGTKFTLVAPIRIASETQVKEWKDTYKKVYTGEALAGKRVLICEDNPLNAEILTLVVERKGMLVECAENGEIGLGMFQQSPIGYYDVVLMDIRMPVMDGITATVNIRGLARADAGTVPIIAVTANVYEDDIKQTRAAGMNAHLGKPINPRELYETMGGLLDLSSTYQQTNT